MKKTIAVNQSALVVLRVMLSGIFIVAGLSHVFNIKKTSLRLVNARYGDLFLRFTDPEVLVVLSGIIMFIAGILFMLGVQTRQMAYVLIVLLIPITLIIQVGQWSTLGPLFKNLAILGGLLFFILNPKSKNQTH